METTSGAIGGTCLLMCPPEELSMREREGLLHILEATTPMNEAADVHSRSNVRPKADPSKTVKQFSRPAAGRADTDPANLRPAPVLRETVTYLYESIIPRDHPAWYNIYQFVFDRLRAVRQDMVIQGIVGYDAIGILEQVVRFHLYASYRLREATIDQFDPVINKQHLLECLKRLLYLYQVTPGPHVNREEFESVYLLDNLGDHHAMTHFLDLGSELRKSSKLRKCYEINEAYILRNYTRALRLIWKLLCAMCLCAVNPHLHNLRVNLLQILSAGHSVKNCKFPTSKLTQILHLTSDQETIGLCTQCGLIDAFDNLSTDYVCFNKVSFSRPRDEQPPFALPVLDEILVHENLSSLLLGQQGKKEDVFDLKALQHALSNLGPEDTTGSREEQHSCSVSARGGHLQNSTEVESNRSHIQQNPRGRGRGKIQSKGSEFIEGNIGERNGTPDLDSGEGTGSKDGRGMGDGKAGGPAVIAGGNRQGDCGPRGVALGSQDTQQMSRGRGRGRGRGRRDDT